MLEVKTELNPVLFLDPERCQDGRNGTQHDFVDIVVVQPLLFGEHFRNDELCELFEFVLLHHGPLDDGVVKRAADCWQPDRSEGITEASAETVCAERCRG